MLLLATVQQLTQAIIKPSAIMDTELFERLNRRKRHEGELFGRDVEVKQLHSIFDKILVKVDSEDAGTFSNTSTSSVCARLQQQNTQLGKLRHSHFKKLKSKTWMVLSGVDLLKPKPYSPQRKLELIRANLLKPGKLPHPSRHLQSPEDT